MIMNMDDVLIKRVQRREGNRKSYENFGKLFRRDTVGHCMKFRAGSANVNAMQRRDCALINVCQLMTE